MAMVNASLMFARGLKSNFLASYKPMLKKSNPMLGELMDLSFESDGAAEDYPYYLSPPHPTRVDKGDVIPHRAFGARRFRVVNKKWQLSVDWHADDEADDQTNGLVAQARAAGEHFALLPERVFFQILTGTADTDLLPAIPNAGDGAALFATQAAGANRFGATNGNLLAGQTLDTPADVRSAIWNAVEQFGEFQDTEGQPLYPDDYVMRHGIFVLHDNRNQELFEEALGQGVTLAVGQNVAGTENVGAAGVTNTLLSSGMGIRRWATQRIRDNSIYVAIRNPAVKAIFRQVREPLHDNVADFANSDRTRESEIKSVYWRERAGYGVCGEPYQIIKITT